MGRGTLRQHQRILQDVLKGTEDAVLGSVDPIDVGLGGKPGDLPLGVTPCGLLEGFHGLGQGFLATQVSQKLLVSNGLGGGGVAFKDSFGHQPLSLLQKPL